MKILKPLAFISITALVLLSVAYAAETSPANRPAHWAKPMQVKGAPNLHKVSDTLYRSAQPSPEGMANLKTMGIETIVNLRSFHSDRDAIGDTGLTYEHIYMKAWHPEEEEAVRFLQIATNPRRGPVLVHCQHGADRTGAMCALYRIAVQGWTKEEAMREMTKGGFGFHGVWKNLPHWFENLDIEAIRKKAGIKSTLRLPGLKAWACSGLTLSGASLPCLKGQGLALPNGSSTEEAISRDKK